MRFKFMRQGGPSFHGRLYFAEGFKFIKRKWRMRLMYNHVGTVFI